MYAKSQKHVLLKTNKQKLELNYIILNVFVILEALWEYTEHEGKGLAIYRYLHGVLSGKCKFLKEIKRSKNCSMSNENEYRWEQDLPIAVSLPLTPRARELLFTFFFFFQNYFNQQDFKEVSKLTLLKYKKVNKKDILSLILDKKNSCYSEKNNSF